MKTRRRIIITTIAGSLLLAFGLFQNCAPHKFTFDDVQMKSLTSSSALSYETLEDTPLIDKVPRAAALAGESSTVVVTSSPRHGDITLNSNGDFTYTPYKDFYGEDQFEYSESGSTATANLKNKKVLINVLSVNDVPWLDTDLVNFEMNTPADFILTGKDVEDSKIDVLLESGNKSNIVTTSNGSLQMLAPGSFKYTPKEFFRGVDSYEFSLVDANGAAVKKKVLLVVGNPLHNLQPALAIRGMGCISCHAKVESAVITDFGKGSPYEIAAHSPFNYQSKNAEKFYGDHTGFHPVSFGRSWITSKISGTITVPAVPIGFDPAAEMQKMLNDFPGWVNNYYPGQYTVDQINSVIETTKMIPEYKVPSTASLRDFIQAIESEKAAPAKVVEKSAVFIGAPTRAVILERASMIAGEKIKFVKNNQITSPALSGISLQPGGYYQNSSEVVCDGDLVIDGTLFLDNLTLNTDDGCRIMTTGPVFIQGAIVYKRIDTTRTENHTNLQVVSARFISLGVGKSNCENAGNPGWYSANPTANQNPFEHRFNEYGAYTRLTGKDDNLLAADKTSNLTEMQKISGLLDASCYSGTVPREVNVERLLLNAPRIDSRYTGQFNGVIIAEAALFSLSKFTFKYDKIFDRVPVLPILKSDDFLMVK